MSTLRSAMARGKQYLRMHFSELSVSECYIAVLSDEVLRLRKQAEAKDQRIAELEREMRYAFDAGWRGGFKIAKNAYAPNLEEAWKQYKASEDTRKEASDDHGRDCDCSACCPN